MDTNALTDLIGDYLDTGLYDVGDRIYLSERKTGADYPYIVYRVENVNDSYPSIDFYLNIDVYEDPQKTIRNAESIADMVQIDFNHKTFHEGDMALHMVLEQRQSIKEMDLINAYFINMRFNVRAYFE